jgi:glycine/D-amino acid oxidase-like deaminating enzyme/nitrite reductase/ring-hydroxylating ferredoxin subunit
MLLERDRIAAGATGHTTAHLTEAIDSRYRTLISRFGVQGARLAARSSRDAIDFIEATARALAIECDFRRLPGYLYSEDGDGLRELRREQRAAERAGVRCDWVEAVPLRMRHATRLPQGIRFPNQAHFHVRKYLLPLAQEFVGLGGVIHERSPVHEFADGEPCRLRLEGGEVAAADVLVLTGSPAANRVFLITKVAAYRTYAIGVRLRGRIPLEGLYWDDQDPYHYLRMQDDVLIIGGGDHKVAMGDEADAWRKLEEYAWARFDVDSIPYRWSGQVLEPVDGLPYIGLNSGSKRTWVGTGFSGNGMTFGTLSGMILADRVLGRENPYARLYEATRVKPLAGAREYLEENKDYPVCLARDWIGARATAESVEDVRAGEGKVVRVDGRPVAVYRHPGGELQAVSAVCTHLACHVRFNDAERSWDCPCHGSRFGLDGKVLTSPATEPLAPVAITARLRRRRSA